jgi:hypothetical protein
MDWSLTVVLVAELVILGVRSMVTFVFTPLIFAVCYHVDLPTHILTNTASFATLLYHMIDHHHSYYEALVYPSLRGHHHGRVAPHEFGCGLGTFRLFDSIVVIRCRCCSGESLLL